MARATTQRRGRRRLCTVWCVAVLLLAVGAAPAAADVPDVCARAGELRAAGLPQQALALLERLDDTDTEDTAGACVAQERTAAVQQIGQAEVLVGYGQGGTLPQATRTALAEAESNPDKPFPLCGRKVSSDTDGKEWFPIALACDAENRDAVATSFAQDLEVEFRRAVDEDVQPWEYGALALLTVLVVGAALARLMQRVIPTAWLRGDRGLRGAVGAAWLAVLVTSVLLIVSVTAAKVPPFVVAAWLTVLVTSVLLTVSVTAAKVLLFVGVVVAWVLAVAALSWASARRMRLLLTVRRAAGDASEGVEDKVATGHVLALLSELGSEAPRGLETVVGADVTALNAAGLVTAPQGKLASAVFQFLRVFWRQAPWEVTVSVVSEDLQTVQVSRNGRHVRSAVVDRNALGLETTILAPDGSATERKPDLHRMTAAVVLCALHEAYGFPGLGGARSWRSVGLQYIATTDHRGHPTEWELLAQAVNDDPGNTAALLALWHARYRTSTDGQELKMYASLLKGYLKREQGLEKAEGEYFVRPRREGEDALLMRALYAIAVAKVNGSFAGESADRRAEATTYLHCLNKLINKQEMRKDGPHALALRLKDPVVTMLGSKLLDDAPISPVAHYQHACNLGSRPQLDEHPNSAKALDHLWLADADPQLASWREKDPQLEELHGCKEYVNVYGRAPVTNLLESPSFTPFADRLRLMRVRQPEQVLAEHARGTLAGILGTTPALADTLTQLASLILSVPPGLPRYEVAESLWSNGTVRVRAGKMPELVKPVLDHLRPLRLDDAPQQEKVLRTWLEGATHV